jgi:hypothetical protein
MEFILFVLFAFILFASLIAYAIYSIWVERKEKLAIREQIDYLAKNALELSPQEFFEIRNKKFGGRGGALYSNNFNFTGVYILHNQSKDSYYVGQGKKVLDRVNSHFTGKGNGDIYADYKYGDKWTIKMIALDHSSFDSLNELEKYTIEIYHSYEKGYNRTRGNKG